MSNRKDIYTRRTMLATLASSGLGLAAYTLIPQFDTGSANAAGASGKKYYVKAGASSNNTGLSPVYPFPTIQQAADISEPGDTIYVMNGTYTETSNEGAVLITRSGEPDAPITYRAFPGHQPVVTVSETTWNHIHIQGASYINIYGFIVEGRSASYTREEALANKSLGKPRYNANGIFIRADPKTKVKPHHIRIIGNVVHHCPGGGIGTDQADYVTIQGNIVYANAWYSVYGNSGISLFRPRNTDNETGYKNFLLQNIAFDNEGYIPWFVTNKISDGNGIIVDTTKATEPNETSYVGRTLVANNLSFENGGSGIHAFKSEHIDIINNTVYNNSRSPDLTYGGLFALFANDVNLFNNVIYARTGEPTTEDYQNTNVNYDYNIYFNGIAPVRTGPHDIIADPLFVNPTDDFATANFSVKRGSPAIDSGTTQLAPHVDLAGRSRVRGNTIDRGAFEGTSYFVGWQWADYWRKGFVLRNQ